MPKPAQGIMTLPMSVAIVVLSYNHPQLTSRAVRSALQFSLPIYLVHNGSEEKNYLLLEREFSDIPNVTHVLQKHNLGYSGGANLGLRTAFLQHDWVVFVTNDCELLNLPEIPHSSKIIAPRIEVRKTHKVDSIGGLFSPVLGQLRHCRQPAEWQDSEHAIRYIPGSAFLVHRDFFKQTGGFDERLGTYWEDVDLSVRAQLKGLELAVAPEWRLTHSRGKTCHKHSLYSLYYFQRNRILVSRRYLRAGKGLRVRFYKNLTLDLMRIGLKLLLKKRFEDLKLFLKAIYDSSSSSSSSPIEPKPYFSTR